MPEKIILYGGSFNPMGLHHRKIIEALVPLGGRVIVQPCGPRPDKETTNDISPLHRAVICDMTVAGHPRVTVDLSDLERDQFTRTWEVDARYRAEGKEVWHVIGEDLVAGGQSGKSQIQREWERGEELWQNANFIIVRRSIIVCDHNDYPPHHMVLRGGPFEGSSSEIRERVFKRESTRELLPRDVDAYVDRHNLYRGRDPVRSTQLDFEGLPPHVLVVADPMNKAAMDLAAQFVDVADTEHPELIVVIGGDGTMLHAIRDHWRKRVPFFGINMGHRGFLMNPPESFLMRPQEKWMRRFKVCSSPLLYVEVEMKDGSVREELAFNDAWVQCPAGKMVTIEVAVDNEIRIPRLNADGVLVATAAGSTGYARSMGATPLMLGASGLVLVGSNVYEPHGWEPVHFSLDSTVEFRNADPTKAKRPVLGFVDGVPMGEVERMRIRASRIAAAEIADVPEYNRTKRFSEMQYPKNSG